MKLRNENETEFTHTTPSGIAVKIISTDARGYSLMSNGAIIPPDMEFKWRNDKANATLIFSG